MAKRDNPDEIKFRELTIGTVGYQVNWSNGQLRIEKLEVISILKTTAKCASPDGQLRKTNRQSPLFRTAKAAVFDRFFSMKDCNDIVCKTFMQEGVARETSADFMDSAFELGILLGRMVAAQKDRPPAGD